MAKQSESPAEGVLKMSVPTLNVAVDIGYTNDDQPPHEAVFTHTTDDGLASRRDFTHRVRSHEELAAAKLGDLPAGFGLSLRQRMAGAAENNQFPWRTDIYGKQRT